MPLSTPGMDRAGGYERGLQKQSDLPPTPAHTGVRAMVRGLVTDFAHLPSKENALWAGLGGGMALAVHPADDNINAHLVGKSWVHDIFTPRKDHRRDTNPSRCRDRRLRGRAIKRPAKGLPPRHGSVAIGGGRRSIDADVEIYDQAGAPGWQWPQLVPVRSRGRHIRLCDGPGTSSGMARRRPRLSDFVLRRSVWLHENRHFASDVVFGSAVGIIAGRTVTRHGREYFSADLHPIPGGVALLFVRRND